MTWSALSTRQRSTPATRRSPSYLLPDGDEADEGYAVLHDALRETGKVAIGQLIMTGRAHLVGIEPHDNGLMLVILRYAHEVREAEPYFERLTAEPKTEAIALAAELIELDRGFRPDTMKDQFAAAIEELVKAKLEQRAPEIALDAKGAPPKVINIMAALKQSVQAKGTARDKEAVRNRSGNERGSSRGDVTHTVWSAKGGALTSGAKWCR